MMQPIYEPYRIAKMDGGTPVDPDGDPGGAGNGNPPPPPPDTGG